MIITRLYKQRNFVEPVKPVVKKEEPPKEEKKKNKKITPSIEKSEEDIFQELLQTAYTEE